jgi:predicted dehydrogenase
MAEEKPKQQIEPSDLSAPAMPAPELPYKPQGPKSYSPAIGLIGCGAITADHLTAYRAAGYRVTALCDLDRARADQRREEFFPDAEVFTDHRALLARPEIEVVDIATHPPLRPALVEAALIAGKHVLSQKPFVLDLNVGRRLADLADERGVRLAVNQNGRWAPHFSYLRHAVAAGLLGDLAAVHFGVHWDHNWVEGTEFENVRHLILYDFAIHWFDMLTCLMGDRQPLRVYASFTRSAGQRAKPALLGQSLVEYEGAQATLAFDGDARFGAYDVSYATGTHGTIISQGPDTKRQTLTLYTAQGHAQPKLEGVWFPDAFAGPMGELLRAIEENREPSNSARNNLRSLALCFAAVASSETHEPVVPGGVEAMPAKEV